MIRTAIIGAAGLSGQELIRILSHHPEASLDVVTSTKYAGQRVGDVFPQFSRSNLTFQPNDVALNGAAKDKMDLAFLAIPNQASLDIAPKLLKQGIKVIDLSGVFRLKNVAVFEQRYALKQTAPDALKEAAFGLPEAYRELIRAARLVANPGCYPTGALIGLLPLGELAAQLAAPPIIDAKSGVSGAGGRVEDESTNFLSVNENFKAYKVFSHQHQPEIEQVLEGTTPYRAAKQGAVIFTPHLLPIARGIFSTIYLCFDRPMPRGEMWTAFADFAAREPFVKLLPDGKMAELAMVQGNNDCVISLHPDETGKNWVVCTVIDNLLKGASGQAVQNMNLMFGLEETAGLV
jgi:N-acetyl-gamma-glutamyl-phosphate reductase